MTSNANLFSRLSDCFPEPLEAHAFIRMPEGSVLSYADVMQRTARLANRLVERGVAPGDRVAVQVRKCTDALMLYLATVRAGAVFLPLNTAYTEGEIGYFISDAEPVIFVCDPASVLAYQSIADKNGTRLETLNADGGSLVDGIEGLPDDYETVARSVDDLAAILYTSGTTGRSKGAMLTHGNLWENGRSLIDYWQFSQSDVLLHALPIFHTHGLFVATNVTLIAGASMIFFDRFDPDALMAHMPHATSMMGVPTFYTRLLDHDGLNREATAHMRLFISGSAPLLAETHRQFEDRTGHRILERYGMTETNMNTSNPYDGDRRPGTVGYPLPGVEIRVVEPETAQVLSTGEVGVVEVRGSNVFTGYWRMPEKTAEEFRPDGFFITGDIGVIDEDGYLTIVGRAKDLIISGGFNVYPKEVEDVVDLLEGVRESAVIGVPHPDFGEGVVAVVVPEAGTLLEAAALKAALDGKLAKFKLPKSIFVVDALPRNTMGKVQKNVLRETYAGVFAPGS